MNDESVQFLKGSLIEKKRDPLAGRELSSLVLSFNPFRPSPFLGGQVSLSQFFESVFQAHTDTQDTPGRGFRTSPHFSPVLVGDVNREGSGSLEPDGIQAGTGCF